MVRSYVSNEASIHCLSKTSKKIRNCRFCSENKGLSAISFLTLLTEGNPMDRKIGDLTGLNGKR